MKQLIIVMYHYVRNLKNSRYPEIKGLDLELFKEQIKYLIKNYYIVRMEDVIDSVYSNVKLPDKAVLLTFDDGYIDHYLNVFPILNKYKLQGSFYAPVKAITEHTVLDVNKIHFILSSIEDKHVLLNELKSLITKFKEEYQLHNFDYYYKKLAQVSRYDTKEVVFIKRLLQVELIKPLRTTIVNILFEKYIGMNEEAFSRELYMNQDQIKHLLRSGMHIGNHGYNHYWWHNLDEVSMRTEIELSTTFLKKIGVNENHLTAAYPYGSYDDQSIKVLNEFGYKLAVTTEVDIAVPIYRKRFLMPRLDTNDLPKDSNYTGYIC